MYPPEECPPLAGRKRHACQCPPRPVFCPDKPRPLDPGCAAKPHYTVPDRIGAQGLPGRGTRGGVADPSPVRRILPERRAQARFGLKAREAMGVVLVGNPKQHAPGDPSPARQPAGSSRRMPRSRPKSRLRRLASKRSLRLAVRAADPRRPPKQGACATEVWVPAQISVAKQIVIDKNFPKRLTKSDRPFMMGM
ncbi:hypothetical protein C814_03301 [Anaerotruncus sp. G3(2012)]|nr:hypothetical protein C814_03301 [Anaerotruncus sp. G3(2012)]